jgi:transcriptional regulator with XRE-family HTH domain
MDTIAGRIKAVRGKLSRAAFADAVGISMRALANYEQGARLPHPSAISKICAHTGVSADWLLTGSSRSEYPAEQAEHAETERRRAHGDTGRGISGTICAEESSTAAEIRNLYVENMRLSRELNTALTAHIAALREIADLRVENEKLRKKEANHV